MLLTAGVDIQKDRIEVEVVGWGKDLESWSVDHVILEGDVYRASVWERLTEVLEKSWPHESGGSLRIRLMAVDSGYATTEVYKWARTKSSERVMVVKGASGKGTIIGSYTTTDAGVGLWNVNVNELKSEIHGLLKLRPDTGENGQISGYPPGYCHFPMYGEEFFEQLTAESQIMETDRKGFQKLVWKKMRDRNEALDLRNYARAAAEKLKVGQYASRHWAVLENELAASRNKSIPAQVVPGAATPPRKRRESSWL